MSNLRKRQAINSDQETYGITERRVRNTLLWANVDNNVSNTNENTELLRPVGKQTGKVLELSFKSGVGGFEIPESYFTSSATNASALNVPIVFVGSETLTNFTDTANSRSVSGEELVFQLKFIKQMNLNPDSSIDSSYIRYNILNHGYNYKVGDSFVIIEQNLRIGGDATKNLVVTIEKIN
tara:strand:+ start:3792 stop:4334 length:543 start_codon:yes stop_codon:yes gene_type:complete